jgi:hypothetical protein
MGTLANFKWYSPYTGRHIFFVLECTGTPLPFFPVA